MSSMESKLRKCAYALADKHLGELPSEAILANSPSNYGPEVTDDHRMFVWNGLVDHYMELPDTELYGQYLRHVTDGEPIIKALIFGDMSAEMEQLVQDIADAIWDEGTKRLLVNENAD